MKRLITLTIAVVLFGVAQTWARPSESEILQSWTASGLKFKFTDSFLYDGNCETSSTRFYGCIQAIQTFLAANNQRMALITNNWPADLEPKTTTVVKDLGFYKIVSIPKESEKNDKEAEDFLTIYSRYRDQRQATQNVWAQVFQSLEQNPFPYDDLLAWIKTKKYHRRK